MACMWLFVKLCCLTAPWPSNIEKLRVLSCLGGQSVHSPRLSSVMSGLSQVFAFTPSKINSSQLGLNLLTLGFDLSRLHFKLFLRFNFGSNMLFSFINASSSIDTRSANTKDLTSGFRSDMGTKNQHPQTKLLP